MTSLNKRLTQVRCLELYLTDSKIALVVQTPSPEQELLRQKYKTNNILLFTANCNLLVCQFLWKLYFCNPFDTALSRFCINCISVPSADCISKQIVSFNINRDLQSRNIKSIICSEYSLVAILFHSMLITLALKSPQWWKIVSDVHKHLHAWLL